eukprot:jgi/Chlat1/784/Chrsp104S01253
MASTMSAASAVVAAPLATRQQRPAAESAASAPSSFRGARLTARAVSFRPAARRSTLVVANASPKIDQLKDMVAKGIQQATETCEDGTAEECATAWDEVEEMSAEVAHKKTLAKEGRDDDPLETFCKDRPEADECRVYED